MAALLDVRNLTVDFPRPRNSGGPAAPAALTAVRGMSFEIDAGEVLGLAEHLHVHQVHRRADPGDERAALQHRAAVGVPVRIPTGGQ